VTGAPTTIPGMQSARTEGLRDTEPLQLVAPMRVVT